ncbi:A-kinase anchor protein 12b isoform X1 [Astatotilapia calliptera]|uniref:A kinase-anchoring proteins AKAP-5 and AKAP-12 calmodulin (CaM)-binding domain-containing protein n=2 Tax=Astatotilapia calliptera TaxID=8154 RepID=A0A3P8QG87_ASTCA|nr:A-kinase anchor protein 12 isoform X1 [Astatotilapia calliptera]
MGAQNSAQQDGKSQEDASASASASAGDLSAEVKAHQEGDSVLDSKSLQKNGQISSMTSLNGHSEDNTLAEVGQPDGVSVGQKEDATETMDTIQDEVTPQVNGEKVDKEAPDANDISAAEEKAPEEQPDDASEVGFKKIFRFVGFKFTLKKDKSEEKDPVKLLTVKDKEGEEGSGTDEPAKEEEEKEKEKAPAVDEKSTAEEKEADAEAAAVEVTTETVKVETTEATPEGAAAAEAVDEAVKEEGAEKEGESTSPPQEAAMSPFRKFFSGGLFSNLRKKASIKKPKEEEVNEVATEEETAKTEETVTAVEEKEVKDVTEKETEEEVLEAAVEEKSEPKEEAAITPQETKSEDHPEPEVTAETPAVAETTNDEVKQEEQKAEPPTGVEAKAPTEVTSEAELLSSQEKAKPQGSPLKKLFTGAGLKKLSTKKPKTKKDTEAKLTESGEQAAEQLQASTEPAEAPKTDSGPSSPEESGEHVIAVEVTQNESSQETEGEVGSDGEKKKEGIMAWSSFKKLVTPKKRVKRSSESEDEAAAEKPAKSATLSSSESAALADKSVEEEAKEDKPSEEEPKTETTEKLLSSTEEPKKKMDTSVSWEALMCMGGPKKRGRKTSDSDDDETKIEEETPATAEVEKEGKTEAATDTEGEPVSSPEPLPSPPERESTWGTLKRMVMPKNKAKSEEKPDESAEQVQSDSEAPKDESSFSLRKFFPGRKKKKVEKQSSTDQSSGEEDSETPAVVPLSEYDAQVEAEPEAQAEPAPVQIKVSSEDRSPSWIPADVEDAADKHDQLSDIPEEAENAATPKSIDTDIAEDETEDPAMLPKPPGRTGRRLSVAEVKPVDPAPAAATTPVPQTPKSENAEEVMQGVESQISEIPSQTCVAVEDVRLEVAAEKTEPEPPIDSAKATTNTILEPHTHDDAMAICTGLGTKEIAKVALEKPAQPLVETVAVIRDSLCSEVSVEELDPPTVEAVFTEDPVLTAQVQLLEPTELQVAVESSGSDGTIQVASLCQEPEIEKVGVVNTVTEESEVLQPTTVSENSPKTVLVSPIAPTSEAVICTQSVEVSEVTVETKEVEMEMEHFAATEENIPVQEVFQATAAEMSSDICETTKTTITEETDPPIPVVLPSEAVPVIIDTVVLVAPVSVEAEKAAATESASESKVADVEQFNSQETTKEVAKTAEAAATPIVETVISSLVSSEKTSKASLLAGLAKQASEKTEEIKEEAQQVSEIEVQSMAIAQTVIQDAVDKVSEDVPEPKKPPTPSAAIPTPVQAIATTENEIDIAADAPVVTETPVPIVCVKPVTKSPQPLNVAIQVIDAIPIEVTENLEEVEKKPEEGQKQDAEIKVSEETLKTEEAGQVKEESQESEEPAQVKEVQSKDQEEAPEKVESQSEETKPEASSEEKKEKVLEVHMPIQVVLQTALVVEEPSIEEEAVEEFDNNGPAAQDTNAPPKSSGSEKLPVLEEEPQAINAVEDAAGTSEAEKTPSKCAEVMAQVIEVIEEAVKEIEPVSTEITAAS